MASLAEVVPRYNSAQGAAVSTRQRVPGQAGLRDKVVLSRIAPKTEEGGLQAEVDDAYAQMDAERKRLDQEIAAEMAELDSEIEATRAKTPSVRDLVPQAAGVPMEAPGPARGEAGGGDISSPRSRDEAESRRTPQQKSLRTRGSGSGEDGPDTSGMTSFADTAMGQTPFGQAVIAGFETIAKGALTAFSPLGAAMYGVAEANASGKSLVNLAATIASKAVPVLSLPATVVKGAIAVFGGGEGDADPIGPAAGAAHGPSGHGAGAGSGKGGGFSGTIGPSAGAAHGPSGHGAGATAGGATGPGAPSGTPGDVGGTMGSSASGAGTSGGGGGGGGK